jgi:hypothetical protein
LYSPALADRADRETGDSKSVSASPHSDFSRQEAGLEKNSFQRDFFFGSMGRGSRTVHVVKANRRA